MYYEFEIKTRLPGLNEYIAKLNNNRYTANTFKAKTEELIGFYIMCARTIGVLPKEPIKTPLEVEIEWHEPNARRDVDNVLSGKKFIFDALQTYGVIVNDSQKYIRQVRKERVIVDKQELVVVRLIEVEE